MKYINDRFGELSERIIDEIAEKLTIVERGRRCVLWVGVW